MCAAERVDASAACSPTVCTIASSMHSMCQDEQEAALHAVTDLAAGTLTQCTCSQSNALPILRQHRKQLLRHTWVCFWLGSTQGMMPAFSQGHRPAVVCCMADAERMLSSLQRCLLMHLHPSMWYGDRANAGVQKRKSLVRSAFFQNIFITNSIKQQHFLDFL